MLARAVFWPAVLKVQSASKHDSNLVRVSFWLLLKYAIRDLLRSLHDILHLSLWRALENIRLPLLLLLSLSIPATLFLLTMKMVTFGVTASQHGLGDALQIVAKYPQRQLIILLFLVPYALEFLVWNSSKDENLDETLDGPKMGLNESALLARVRKETEMKRGLKMPAKEEIPHILRSIEAKAKTAGLSLREYQRRVWLGQNGVQFDEDGNSSLS